MTRGERGDAAHVILVLVRHDDRGQVAREQAVTREARRGVADAEAAIDQDPGRAGLDDEAVAFAAAAQGGEAQSGAPCAT